jgi:CTP:molybdopterin cytidylyltransferase MocA
MMIATTMNAATSERARSSVFDRVVVTVSSRAISIYSMKARSFGGRRRVKFLPMTSTATPVSATAKQQHQNNHNKDQFHRKSPLMVMTSIGNCLS